MTEKSLKIENQESIVKESIYDVKGRIESVRRKILTLNWEAVMVILLTWSICRAFLLFHQKYRSTHRGIYPVEHNNFLRIGR